MLIKYKKNRRARQKNRRAGQKYKKNRRARQNRFKKKLLTGVLGKKYKKWKTCVLGKKYKKKQACWAKQIEQKNLNRSAGQKIKKSKNIKKQACWAEKI